MLPGMLTNLCICIINSINNQMEILVKKPLSDFLTNISVMRAFFLQSIGS